MSAKNIQTRNCSVLRAKGIKRSIMGSALLAGLASTALLYPQAALAQDTASASNNVNLSISTSTVPAGTIPVSAKSVGGGQASLVKNPVLPAKTSQLIEKNPRHLARTSKATTSTPAASARLQEKSSASLVRTQTPAPSASPVPLPASTAPTATTPTQNNNDDVIPIKDSDLKWFFYLNITKSNDYNEDKYNKWQLTNKIVNDTTEIAVHTYGGGTKYYNLSTTDKLDSEEGLELLKKFTNLKKLDVSDCKIDNADKLLDVLPANLESLMLGKHSSLLPNTEDTAILTDTTKLNRFTRLTSLSLKSVTLNSTTFLSHMKDLEDLNLSSTNIHDISQLKNCTKLTKLDISSNDISDISALRSLTQLTDLSIKYNKVASLDGLQACTKLVRLKAKNNRISSLEPLKALTSIQELSLNNNAISSLEPLQTLTTLKKLKIESNAIRNVAPLAGLVKKQTLTVINAKDNHIVDVSSIYDALPEKIRNTDLRRAGDFSYDFTFQTFTFDYKAGSTLDAYGIKAGPSGIDYGDKGTIDAYTGSAYISFSTKDKVDAYQKPNRLLLRPRIAQSFDFSGNMSIYRYRPQLKKQTPLQVDFGAAVPSVEDIRARVTLLHGDTYPKNGRYFLSVGTRDPYPDSPYVQSQQPGALQQLVEVNTFKSGDFQPVKVYVIYYKDKTTKIGDNNSFTDNIDVPVYVKTMAESYAPKTLTLEPGKTLTQKDLEDACTKRIPFTFITKDEAEAHPDKYQQADEENSNSNVWVDPDALSGPDDNPKPNQIFCTKPQFSWGSVTSVSATTDDEGKAKYVPVTITYADGSTWKGKIEIDVPKPVTPHDPSHDGTHDGSHDGTHTPGGDTDDDNPSGTGTDGTGDTGAGTGATNGTNGNGTTNGNDGADNHGAGNDGNGTNGNSATNGNAQPGAHNGSHNGTHTKRGRHFRHAYWQSNVANAGAGLHAGAGTGAGATNGDSNQATNADGTSTSANNGTNGSGSTEGNGSANSSANATAQQAPTADSDVAMHDDTPLSWLLARMRESGFYVLAAIIVCVGVGAWYATTKKRNAAGEQPAAPKK